MQQQIQQQGQNQMQMPNQGQMQQMPMGRAEVISRDPGSLVLMRAINSIIRREAARMDLELQLDDGRVVKASVYAVGNTVRVDLKGAIQSP